MNIKSMQEYEEFESIYEEWFIKNNHRSPIEYMRFLEETLENNMYELWTTWEIDPIQHYLEKQK